MGLVSWVNLIVDLVIVCLVGWLCYKALRWFMQKFIHSSKKVKGLEQRISDLGEKD